MYSKIQALEKRKIKAKAKLSTSIEQVKECYRYALPTINVDNSASIKQDERVFDDTAIIGLNKYANRIQAQLVPSWKKWFILESGKQVKEDDKDSFDKGLSKITDELVSQLNHSNFSSQIHESFKELGISTGAIIVEKGKGVDSLLNFRSISILELIPELGNTGTNNTIFRDFTIQARDILVMYPQANISNEVKRMITDKPDNNIDMVECSIYNPTKGNYNYVVYSKKLKSVFVDKEEDTSPIIVFREATISGQALGFGRILSKLATILKLNKLSFYEDISVGLMATGSYTYKDDGTINVDTIDLSNPFSLIAVGSNDNSNPSIRPLEIAPQFNITDQKIKELQASIEEVMTNQSFGNVEDTPVRSAYEMSVRENTVKQQEQSAYGRLQTELLEPLIKRIVSVLREQGAIQDLKIDGKIVTLRYTNPSAKLQDLEDLQALTKFLEIAQAIPPEVIETYVKMEDIPRFIAERTGLNDDILRNKAEVDKHLQEKQQALVQQSQELTDSQVPNKAQPRV